jgi:hypothetical protein
MGALVAEGLSAPVDYFLPARVLDLILNRLSFSNAQVLFHDPLAGKDVVFAGGKDKPSDTSETGITASFGTTYSVQAYGASASEKALFFMGTSLGACMDASRNAVLSRPYPPLLPLDTIAKNVSSRYDDSQARFATICVLDTESYLCPLYTSFPLVDPSCLRNDLLRILSFLFEAAGGLYASEEGSVIGLACASSPTDTELLQLQLGKSLRRIISPSASPSLPFLRSQLFESPTLESIKVFLLEGKAAEAS